jgi:hypothetical protein
MSASDWGKTLGVLANFYGTGGKRHELNDVQAAVYAKALSGFDASALMAAAERHMAESVFFPKLSELLDLLRPKVDDKALALMAWTTVEQALRRGGIYRGAHFAQGAIGEAFRQTFGSWQSACQFDTDSPGWAIRRQTFLGIFPAIAARPCAPVTMRGLHSGEPYQVPLLAGLPSPLALPESVDTVEEGPIGREDAKRLVDSIQSRWQAEQAKKSAAS